MIKLLIFAVTIVTILIGFGALFLLVSAPFAWLAIGFMSYCRPRLVLGRAALCFIAIWLITVIALPVGNGTFIGILLAVFLAPWPARLWANRAAFRADDSDQRTAAADSRNTKCESEGSRRRVTADKPWPEYMADSDRARLVSLYQLPTSFPR